MHWMPRIRLQFASQLGDVRVHCSAHNGWIISPDLAQQFMPRRDLAFTPDEGREELELLGTQCDGLTASRRCSRAQVHSHVAKDDRAFGVNRSGETTAAQQRVYSREKFQQPERLGDVIVGAKPESANLVRLLA